MNPIVDKSVVDGHVLAHNKFAGFLRCDAAHEGAYAVQLARAESKKLSDVFVFQLGFSTECLSHLIYFSPHFSRVLVEHRFKLSEIFLYLSKSLKGSHY